VLLHTEQTQRLHTARGITFITTSTFSNMGNVRTYYVTMRRVRVTIAVMAEQKIAFFLHRIILPCVDCLALSYVSTLFRKRHYFRGGGY